MTNPTAIDSIDHSEFARCLFEESNDALIVFDPQTLGILDVNPSAQELTRYTRRQLQGLRIPDLLDSEDSSRMRELKVSCEETRIFHSCEPFQLIRGDGPALAVSITVSRIHLSPTPLGVIAIRDVSDRVALQAELRTAQESLRRTVERQASDLQLKTAQLQASEVKYRTIVETTQEWIWETDQDGINIFSNPVVQSILGYLPEEVLGKPNFSLLHSADRDLAQKRMSRSVADGQGWSRWILRWQHKDGATRYLESNAVPVFDRDGKVIGFRGSERDVSERIRAEERTRALEQELSYVSRHSAMGEMAAGIAHELNQPLFAMANYASAVRQALRDNKNEFDPSLEEWLSEIDKQAVRSGDIIRRLRKFSQGQDVNYSAIDLGQVIRDSFSLLGTRLREDPVEVDLQWPDQEISVRGSATELQQVFVNLLCNACDAACSNSGDAGRVLCRCDLLDNTVCVSIEDNGPGVDAATVDQLFEPFFTTKPDGLGMGLAISRTIVQKHQGQLDLKSNSASGACFTVMLPLGSGRS